MTFSDHIAIQREIQIIAPKQNIANYLKMQFFSHSRDEINRDKRISSKSQ